MPFPWTKVKSTRISQLVNDHLHKSQKRRDGSSLVVETGFPTSLIDLFIKNREKLKKPSKKKRQSPPISDAHDPLIAGSPTSFPSPLPSPSPVVSPLIAESPAPPVHSPLRCPLPVQSTSLLPLPSRGVNEVLVVGSRRERGVDANTVLFVVLKMFLVVVLALGTKRLTVGITISAFLLFFLEYVGKHACGFLEPCSETKGVSRSMIQSVWRLLRFKEVRLGEKNSGVVMPELQQEQSVKPGCFSRRSSASRCPDQEIQIVEPKGNLVTHVEEIQIVEPKGYFVAHVEEIQPENEIMDGSCFEGRLGYQEIETKEVWIEKEESVYEVAELKRKSRRARIKSKMKKIFPKKLKCSRREHDPQRLEIVEESVSLYNEQQVEQCEDEVELESASELSSIPSVRYKEEDAMSAICAFGALSETGKEADTKSEENGKEIEAGLTWRYMVLCIVILLGLIGGRPFALLLTLSWCLLLKLGETLPMYMKVPIIRSFKDKPY